MSEKQTPRVEVIRGESDEWPATVKERFDYLCTVAKNNNFSILCAVGLHHEHRRLSVYFSPYTSGQPDENLAELCDDAAEFFQMMAKRFRQ